MSAPANNQKIMVDQAVIFEKLDTISRQMTKQTDEFQKSQNEIRQDFKDFQKEIRENYATKKDLDDERRLRKEEGQTMVRERNNEITKINENITNIKVDLNKVDKSVETLMEERLIKKNSMGAKVGSEFVKNIVKYAGIALTAIALGGLAIAYQSAQREINALQKNVSVDDSKVQILQKEDNNEGGMK